LKKISQEPKRHCEVYVIARHEAKAKRHCEWEAKKNFA